MAVPLCILLILTAVTGIHGITTVRKVSVEAGTSVTIPCLYNSQYRNHVKYLCKGYYWHSCSYAIKTNQHHGSGKFSISDDKQKNIFTVTIKHLTHQNTYYWCAVEIDNGVDVKQYLQLSVTTDQGIARLHVSHQEVTGFRGESVTINCYHSNPGEMKWCMLGGNCVMEPSGTVDETTVFFNRSVPGVTAVTITGLKLRTSGWYWFVQGDIQLPVHLTVTERPTATPSPGSDGAVTTAEQEQTSASVDLKKLIIPLSLLVLILTLALLIWLILKCRQASGKSRATQLESSVEHDGDVTYSSVVSMKKPKVKRSEVKEEDVTYSTLRHCQSHV